MAQPIPARPGHDNRLRLDALKLPIPLAQPTEPADSIRRLDWRFLLPELPGGVARHMVIAGASPMLLAQVTRHRAALRASARIRPPEKADVVAILANAAVSPGAAARAVEPGGLLYYEVSRRRLADLRRTPAWLVAELQGRGFEVSAVYWLLPNAAVPQRYVPLDRTEAFCWYMDAYYSAGSPLELARALCVRGLAGSSGRRFGRLAPAFAVVARAPLAVDDRPRRSLAPAILTRFLNDEDARPVLLTSGVDDGSRVVLLPFRASSRQPEAILKVARIPAFNAHIEREQQTLAELRARYGESIPAPLDLGEHAGLAVGVEEHVHGSRLSALCWRWPRRLADKIDDLQLTTDWIIAFNRSSAQRGSAPDAFAEAVRAAIEEFRASVPLGAGRARLLDRVVASLERIRGPVPVVWRHNDLGPWNVFRTADGIQVIDWEYGSGPSQSLTGPPLTDLIYFATHWYFATSRLKTPAEEAAAFQALYFSHHPPDEAASAVRDAIRRYLSALGIDPAAYPAAFVYAWLVAAQERVTRERRLGQPFQPSNFIHFLDITAAHWQSDCPVPAWLYE